MTWICPKCERELKNERQWHSCAKVSIDSLFEGRPADLVLVFDNLLVEVSGWKKVLVSTTQNCIVFVHRQTFFIIRPMKKELDLKFYSETELKEQGVIKSILHAGKYQNHIRISSVQQLTPALYKLLRKSYELL